MAGQTIDTHLFAEFVSQSGDLLESMRRCQERLLRDSSDMNTVREFYRQMHTLKGNAGMFGFTALKEVSHGLETLLDAVWQGELGMAHDILSALGRGLTMQEQMLSRVTPENVERPLDEKARRFVDYLHRAFAISESPDQRYDQLLTRLSWLCDDLVRPDDTIDEAAIAALLSVVRHSRGEEASEDEADTGNADRSFPKEPAAAEPNTARYLYGEIDLTEPVMLMRRALDDCASAADPDTVDVAGAFAEAARLLAERLEGDELGRAAVTLGEETATITGSGMPIDETLRGLLEESYEEFVKHLEIRRASEGESGAEAMRVMRVPEPKLHAIEEELQDHETLIGVLEGILEKTADSKNRCDTLPALRRFHDSFVGGNRRLKRVVSGLIREPLSQLFRNLPLQVDEMAGELKREVHLRVVAEDVMLPRVTIESIESGLVHLVRNAVGHGIEPPAERKRVGKPPSGTLRVEGVVEDDDLVVTISDDGRGIDVEKVREAALKKKLVDPDTLASMPEDEVLRLVLMPSCSTAESLTDVSGRGIGLDMVNGVVQNLGGEMTIENHPGEGVAFILRLPLRPGTATLHNVSTIK